MRQSGDDKKGYSIEKRGSVLLLKVWGLWDDDLADRYKADMLASYPEMQGQPWYVVADISKFPPQKDYTQQIHGWLMGEAVKAGMVRAASVVESSLTKMQISRIAKESGMPELAFHTEVDSAVQWVQSA